MTTKTILIGIAFLLLYACSPRYIFYHSNASVPQSSYAIKSEFKYIQVNDVEIPFAVIAAYDKEDISGDKDYYVLLTPDNPYKFVTDIENYIDPYHVILRDEKVQELIKMIDKTLPYYKIDKDKYNGTNFEYNVSQEFNINRISQNVDNWKPDFKFIVKNYARRCEAFVKLGVLDNLYLNYYLNYEQLLELRTRLQQAFKEFSVWGYKKNKDEF